MRCFIAVGCPSELRDELAKAQERVVACGGMKAVEYENLHLTLKFLGEVGESRLDALIDAPSSVKCARFKVSAKGVGVFPNPGNPKVVWAGLGEGFEDMMRLHGLVDSALEPLGFEADERFHPHITLARVKGATDKSGLKAVLADYSELRFGAYEVDGFDLMESRLTPEGPIYANAKSFRFI